VPTSTTFFAADSSAAFVSFFVFKFFAIACKISLAPSL
jgi:hypothetical protein